jgi:hypothetical protein
MLFLHSDDIRPWIEASHFIDGTISRTKLTWSDGPLAIFWCCRLEYRWSFFNVKQSGSHWREFRWYMVWQRLLKANKLSNYQSVWFMNSWCTSNESRRLMIYRIYWLFNWICTEGRCHSLSLGVARERLRLVAIARCVVVSLVGKKRNYRRIKKWGRLQRFYMTSSTS